MPMDLTNQIQQLQSGDVEQRLQAAQQLSTLGEGASAAAMPLISSLADSDERINEHAIAALEGMGRPSVKLVDQLAFELSSANNDCAYWAATLLGRLGSDAASAVPQLCNVVGGKSCELAVRQRAAWALGKMGPVAREALDALHAATQCGDPRLARLSQSAIKAITS